MYNYFYELKLTLIVIVLDYYYKKNNVVYIIN